MLFEEKVPHSMKMSMSTLYMHSFLYYDSIYTYLLLPFQLFLFIYKYNSLLYTSGRQAGEIVLLLLAILLNWIRIQQGRAANKGKSVLRFFVYFILTVAIIMGFVYLIVWQPYVYWLEFIMHIIAIIIVGVELLVGIVSLITYKVNEYWSLYHFLHL